ncbi:HD domain-containing protein [Alteribacter keqinensis]|uniref:HD domain-containing protein n=1 Tax=Alteribacter keqinensis TaxID=2483800 RepID=A0A3M7TUV4_9BACI|nr:HD domain-containing protein [Alteribacter keqinensis]RNA69426.1 HD domain-containing protein [Alteribacter keqinensis]
MTEMIKKAEAWARSFFDTDSTGHDWFHTDRVRKMALTIAGEEGADLYVTEMTALLHDIADDKFYSSEKEGERVVRRWLHEQKVQQKEIILSNIASVSFSSGETPETLEGKIVQDADRLEAIGAIGIARCFMYAGAAGDPMYDPDIKVRSEMSKKEYRTGKSTAVNHFYEKLLKLSCKMNTNTGRNLAKERHRFLESFLGEFFDEWDGRK